MKTNQEDIRNRCERQEEIKERAGQKHMNTDGNKNTWHKTHTARRLPLQCSGRELSKHDHDKSELLLYHSG